MAVSVLAPVIHILPITLIRRERLSPVPGRVLVRQGQTVGAADVIVEANLYPEHLLLNVSRVMKLSPKVADKYITVREGEQIAKGDVIAGPIGVARRVLRSPRDGRVILAGDGQVLIDVTQRLHQIRAGIPGEVVDLIPERGVVIETTGALIQGVWGNGKIDYGLMVIAAKSPDHEIAPDQLDVSMRGAVVMAGHCNDAEVLKTADELPLRGLILSTISPSCVPAAKECQVPVIVLDGFGHRPFNTAAYKLLTTSDRREVAINPIPWDRTSGIRPELIIPLPGKGSLEPPSEAKMFEKGQMVRALRAPYAGKIGKITSIKENKRFQSGLHLQAAEIRLEDGDKVVVPLANLEVLA